MKRDNGYKNRKNQKVEKNEIKKKGAFPEHLQDYDDEDLNLNELFDIEGGKETEPQKSCGLGCYINGFDTTTQTQEIEHE